LQPKMTSSLISPMTNHGSNFWQNVPKSGTRTN
jgi:hypothetical protein